MKILSFATLSIWFRVTVAKSTTTEALAGDADDYKEYGHRILRLDPRTVDYKDGNGGVVGERVHVNSSSNNNNYRNNKNKKNMIKRGIGNGKSSLQTQEQVSTMHPLDGRCQSTRLDETQKARLGCPPPQPPPQQQPTLKTVTISNAAQESNYDSNVKSKTDIDSSTTTNLRTNGQSFAATVHGEDSQVNHKVVNGNNSDDDDTFQAQASDVEELAVKPSKLGGESTLSRSRRCHSPTLSAAMKKRLKCPETTTTAATAVSSSQTTISSLEANSSVKEIKIKSDDSESATSLMKTPERTMAPKEYMEALSFAVNGHGPEVHARDDGGAATIDDATVASQNDTANDDDDAVVVETAAPSPTQEQLLPVVPTTTKSQNVISAMSSQTDNTSYSNATDDAAADVVVVTTAVPPQQPQQQELNSAPVPEPPTTAVSASASDATSSTTTSSTTKSQNVHSNNNQVSAESVATSSTTTTTNRRMSRRKFLSYVPSQWETIWMNGIREWENNFSICEQFQQTSTDDADSNNELLQQQKRHQSEYLSKYMNFLCQERFEVPYEGWCYLHDGRHHIYYNTESQKTTGTWEIYADQTPAVLQDVDLPNSTKRKSFVSPQKGDEDVFSKFVFLDETTGEVYEEYIEPLVSHLRFPLAQCQNNNIQDQIRAEGLAWFTGYVMPPPSLSRFQRKFYIDVGGDRWQRLHYVARTWERQDGGAWDSIYSFANHVKDATFFKKMPDSVRDILERQDVDVTIEPTDKDGEQFLPDFIEKETHDDDYVLLKLDKGSPATKEGIVQYILDHVGEVHVDELIWQHNLEHNYLMKALFDTVEPQPLSDQSLSEAYDIFTQLRQKGIRAHAWI